MNLCVGVFYRVLNLENFVKWSTVSLMDDYSVVTLPICYVHAAPVCCPIRLLVHMSFHYCESHWLCACY